MEANSYQAAAKRATDVMASILALAVLSPVFVAIAVLTKLDSSGPVFYRRRAVGLNGGHFDALKFRTMIVGADEFLRRHPQLWADYQENIKLRNDPRVTRVGRRLRRLSLDELPQLVNVLRGDMSLVGPRIVAPDELAKYGECAAKRLTVRPGITGLWQVSGRQDVSYETRVRLDMEYIDNWSLWLDLKILLRTVPVVLCMRGAY